MENDEIQIDLLKLANTLWKKTWIVVLIAAICGAAMFVYKKSSYVPVYQAQAILFARYTNNNDLSLSENADSTSQSNLSASQKIVNTCYAVLNTRMALEAVIEEAGLDMTSQKLSGMITTATLHNSELFSVTVTSNDPEEAALIANTVANVLPSKVLMVNPNSLVGTIDSAQVPISPNKNDILKDTALSAVLGAFLVISILTVKALMIDYREQKSKLEHSEK